MNNSHEDGQQRFRIRNFIFDYSVLLIAGAAIALVWANLSPHSYHAFIEFAIFSDGLIGEVHAEPDGKSHRILTVHYFVNDVLMAFFFAVAAKEVWEAIILKDGSLRGRKALTPLIATAGGMVGPIAVYLGIALLLGSDTYNAVANGWAIPTATDIAFSYLVGRIIFGAGHPAVRFLLLLAIADDAAGLLILAIFYPSGELVPEWLLLSVGASAVAFILFNYLPLKLDRGRSDKPVSTFVNEKISFWPYAVAAALSWYGFQESGLHPALGLIPVIPAIPHADRDLGHFAAMEKYHKDILNRIEHMLKYPVEIILFFFGLANSGVEFSSIGSPTMLVLLGLIVGKPVGIYLFGWVGAVPMRLGVPDGMRVTDILIVGFIAAIGFTVSLFIATVAFDPGPVQDAAKMGALLSLGASAIAILVSRAFKIDKVRDGNAGE